MFVQMLNIISVVTGAVLGWLSAYLSSRFLSKTKKIDAYNEKQSEFYRNYFLFLIKLKQNPRYYCDSNSFREAILIDFDNRLYSSSKVKPDIQAFLDLYYLHRKQCANSLEELEKQHFAWRDVNVDTQSAPQYEWIYCSSTSYEEYESLRGSVISDNAIQSSEIQSALDGAIEKAKADFLRVSR